MAFSSNTTRDITAGPNARIHVGNNITLPKGNSCLADLWVTDPLHDQERIVNEKGGLLQDAFRWILKTNEFLQWHHGDGIGLLWIKGEPGKGKTMLMCGLVDELRPTTRLATAVNANKADTLLGLFFCQANDDRINTGTAVLRTVIWLLVKQEPGLLRHVEAEYAVRPGQKFLEGPNAWFALKEIFFAILSDSNLPTTLLLLDALDECISDRDRLLKLIADTLSRSYRVKWIVSSRNWPEIEKHLQGAEHGVPLSLELNADSVSGAVQIYIQQKTSELAQSKDYDETTYRTVRDYLSKNANGTFLWVALVCRRLTEVRQRHVVTKLQEFPPGLDALYHRIMERIMGLEDDVDLCKEVLAIACTVFRPITLHELCALMQSVEATPQAIRNIKEIVQLCGSFLTLSGESGVKTVHFIHQSAKDYLVTHETTALFPSGQVIESHRTIFHRSLDILGGVLLRDIYGLHRPGTILSEVISPDPDPLATIRYACIYWADHAQAACGSSPLAPADIDKVYNFLTGSFLYWLEALCLMQQISQGILTIRKLEGLVRESSETDPSRFIHDALRFLLYHRPVIEEAPLQAYSSALLFSPHRSLVRQRFWKQKPGWVVRAPRVEADWSPCVQTLTGHGNMVEAVAWSPDGRHIVSGSLDRTVKIWEAATGSEVRTLTGHKDLVYAVAWSPDGRHIVSGSGDNTLKIWEAATESEVRTLTGHREPVYAVAWSPDGQHIVSGSADCTVKIWEAATESEVRTLMGHRNQVYAVAWSPDGRHIVSGSFDCRVKIWEAATELEVQTLTEHWRSVYAVAWSPNGRYIVSGSADNTLKIWEAVTESEVRILTGHGTSVEAVAWSPDGRHIVSGSGDYTVKIWEAATGSEVQTLTGHEHVVRSVAWSPDSRHIVSGSADNTLKIWEAATELEVQTLTGHRLSVYVVAWSLDDRHIVSGSDDCMVKIWEAATGSEVQTLTGHKGLVYAVAWSPDGRHIVSGSADNTLKIWEAATESEVRTLTGHEYVVRSVAWSPDGRHIISGSADNTLKIWEAATESEVRTLTGHRDQVYAVAWSPDGRHIVSGSGDCTVKIWEAATGLEVQTLVIGAVVRNISFDNDCRHIVTDVGRFRVDNPSLPQTPDVGSTRTLVRTGLGVSADRDWITRDGANMIRFPLEYRPRTPAVASASLAWGCLSGRVYIIQSAS